jgi:hypothetical protein
MGTKRIGAEQKASVTQDKLDKAVLEARQQGEMIARIEVGEWIEANLLGGPKENPYSSFFPVMAEHLKQGIKL